MKNFVAIAVGLLGLTLGYGFLLRPFIFISRESKTVEDTEVYNQIEFQPGLQKDTWIMLQSHHGLGNGTDSWDRLEIVVDKTRRPYEAKFYQFKPKDASVSGSPELAPYRTPCFSCHSNGPRAIRPKSASFLQSIKVGLLNLRIKSYWRVNSLAGQAFTKAAPFKRQHEALNTPLELETCTACHSPDGMRNRLTLDQASTAQFLVAAQAMPPWPLKLTDKDRKALEKWGL